MKLIHIGDVGVKAHLIGDGNLQLNIHQEMKIMDLICLKFNYGIEM